MTGPGRLRIPSDNNVRLRSPFAVAAAALALVAQQQAARACTPPPPPPPNPSPCLNAVFLGAPRAPLPVNGLDARSLKIVLHEHSNDRPGAIIPRPLEPSELQVWRMNGGLEPAPFELPPPPDSFSVQTMSLVSPVPGEYLITWSAPQNACAALRPSPTGTGVLITRFNLAPAAPIPTTLGTLAVVRSAIEQIPIGVRSAPCAGDELTDVGARVTLRLVPSAAAAAWWANLAVAVHVDGQPLIGATPAPPLTDGAATFDVTERCLAGAPRGLADGVHRVKLVATVPHTQLAAFETDETTMEIRCAPTRDAEDAIIGGCQAGGRGGVGGVMPLLLLAVAFVLRTGRRSHDGAPR